MVGIAPLVRLDELEDKVDVEALFKLHFELFLHFPDNANQVEESVFDLHAFRREFPREVLVEYLLHERVARRVKLL